MKNIKIPYSTGYKEILLDGARIKGILKSGADDFKAGQSQEELVRMALERPVNSARLRDMAKDKKRVLIITSDHTRPVPSRITLPIILEEVRSLNKDVEIKILIATGFHRGSTYEEMAARFGEDIVNNEVIINHDSRNKEDMSFKGILPSGAELWLNSLVDWADLVISEGFIEPHFFAGFSGGRKSILPGIAYERTVMANHCARFIAHERARAGIIEGNPIHEDMVYAAHVAKLSFILNVVINGKKEIIRAFAGHPDEAHYEGCMFVKQLAEVKAVKADIVITSNGGYPLDQNIYQAVKGMTAAEACVRQNGVIIMVAACNDGHGGEAFFNWFANAESASEVAEKISRIPQMETVPDQWEAQILARVLSKCTVIMVTDMCDPGLIEKMHMKHASSIEEALFMAETITGKESDIAVIPDGVGVIVV
jgi:nickel-dependent lactate racemase